MPFMRCRTAGCQVQASREVTAPSVTSQTTYAAAFWHNPPVVGGCTGAQVAAFFQNPICAKTYRAPVRDRIGGRVCVGVSA